MTWVIGILSLLLTYHQPVDIVFVRDTFHRSLTSDESCKTLFKYFNANSSQDATTKAYVAANIAMYVRFVSAPYDKWKAIKKSQAEFEKAVALAPNNPEIRYLRLLIEVNLPSFLPIDKHIDNDTVLVVNNLKPLRDTLGPKHFETARKFLLDDAPLTKAQRQTVQQWKG